MNKLELNSYFVEPEWEIDSEKEQPASYIRHSFLIQKPVQGATLLITALGVYEAYVNGKRLGEQVLTPGFTDYNYRVQYQSHDVTALLKEGENVVGALVGDGWYRGCIGIGSKRNGYGTKTKLMCYLIICYADGTEEVIHTDSSWKASQEGALRENNIKTIERVDARKELTGWHQAGYDDSAWHSVKQSEYTGLVIPQQGELVLEQEQFQPEILHTPNGGAVLDMGQNFAGYVQFQVDGRAGHTVALTMGEVLDEHGDFTMKNLAAEGASLISGEVGQRLEYTLKDGIQVYKPHFLVSGFRYVLLENWPEEVKAENFRGIAIYSDIPKAGTFTCSNPLINQLVQNVDWSRKSNFVDIPADCPTRERSGWTADISVFSETACYMSNPRKFLKKWLQDYKYEQGEDGNLPYVVPSAGKPGRQRGCMGWSDAIANISMTLYRFYGEKEDLEDVYTTVKRFVDFNVERAKKRNPFFFYKFGKHRKYIIETGFHYGEWLEPGTAMYQDFFKDLFYPDTEVTTAWFCQTTMQLAKMAEILGKKEDYETYRELAGKIRSAYQKEFIKNGTVNSKRHCRYVRPVAMNLVDAQTKQHLAEKLNQKCIENEYKIGTGFLTTYKLLSVLADYGYIDTAYRVLENTKQPGWLYAVTKGATTTWENWYGINEKGVPVDSHNHFAPGAVAAWLFAYCAGIQPAAPGFRKVRIQPMPGGTLTHVECSYDSVQGTIESCWKREEGVFSLHVKIPEGIPAEIILPNGEKQEVTGGVHDYQISL